MSLANDALYIIRGALGDQMSNRWSDKFILSELNRAALRMLAIFKRHALDYGMGLAHIRVEAHAHSFALPPDFMGVVGLFTDGRKVELKGVEELETLAASVPLAVWAVESGPGSGAGMGLVRAAPATGTLCRLRYWQAPPALSMPASPMPWNGVFDGPLCDYVRARLANYDEMNTAQDIELMKDLENNMLTLAISRNPTVKTPKGWLG